jgi:ribonuclease P protein component
MLPKSKRVTIRAFEEAMKGGVRIHAPHFFVMVTKAKNEVERDIHAKVAVTVSKKVEKLAVKRNRIKRRIYAILRENYRLLPQGTTSLFFAKAGTLTLPLDDYRRELAEICQKITKI